MIVARGILKPVCFAFETMSEFFLQTTHFVKSRAHSPTLQAVVSPSRTLRYEGRETTVQRYGQIN